MAEVNLQMTVKTRIDADPDPRALPVPSLHPRIKTVKDCFLFVGIVCPLSWLW